MTYFAPSELDFINCKRCFFINKVKGFKLPPNIPGVFSTFDRSQKKYFISKDTDILSKELPKGKFFKTVTQEEIKARLKKNLQGLNELELPAKIGSSELRDKKNRIFILGGLPDLIVKLKDGYGILDFKSTSELDKSQNYKYQLESYAQILENPNNKTPKLSPVLLIGLIQFTPKEIISHENNSISQKWKMQYFKLKRNKDGFYNRITELTDIIEKNQVPAFDARCMLCDYARKTDGL
tara:strand:+ start:62 stop:775 length:714 start_codon:yes stop_codon:yes gene_type:complete